VLGVEDEDPRLKALNEDVSGRISKAVSTNERFNRWGSHYLRAIIQAHSLQLRTNFMDPGLQVYGGSLFDKLQHRGGEIFVSLPMVTSRAQYSYTPTASTTTAAAAPAPDNSIYYGGGGGGCFDASCTVLVSRNGTEQDIPVCDVRKDDLVRVVEGEDRAWAKVNCVVQIDRLQGASDLVEFKSSGLRITKKHPIRLPGQKWQYPMDLTHTGAARPCPSTSQFVYNFLLDGSHVLLVNDVQCVTFGHGITDSVAWDPFYATSRVVGVVEGAVGFDEGFVTISGSLKRLEKHL